MKFYQVISYFYDDGRTSASITNVIEAEEKPQNTHFTLKKYDVYTDYFSTKQQAAQFVKDTLCA